MPLTAMFIVAAAIQTQTRLVAFRPNVDFPPAGQEATLSYENVKPGIGFDEVIPSWNVDRGQNAAITVQIRAHSAGVDTKWYSLGNWSLAEPATQRQSVDGQRDENGNVLTDTLHLAKLGDSVDVQVVLRTLPGGPTPRLKLLTLCFSDTSPGAPSGDEKSPAWGKRIDVPHRAQNEYPNGGVLCSATSVSMMLWHYSNVLHRPELNRDVPEVEKNVWDSTYKGAGNWPFNTAYAGSFAGIESYVSRFGSIADLETLIDAGFPVVCSVSFDMLRGLPLSPTESGHLVVLVGFTPDGDPLINDPAFKDAVHKVYKRADFENAWAYSHRTVYMVYPEGSKLPESKDGLWIAATS